MKFNCDRCKTRYSISDERVRGKVLKIRCKNCSAVITVREGMAASVSSPVRSVATGDSGIRARSDSALRGAFDEAMSRPSAADSMTGAPATLAAEWYMAIDGEQSGPFDLEGAKRWVSESSRRDDAYCWSEGFDDWLLVEKVSHFRALVLASALATGTDISVPSLSAVEPSRLDNDASRSNGAAATATNIFADVDSNDSDDSGGAFEFDIGEASRVVNLASIMPPKQGLADPVESLSPGLPGLKASSSAAVSAALTSSAASTLGSATSSSVANLGSQPAQPELHHRVLARKDKRSSRLLLPLLIASGALLVMLGVLLIMVFRGGGDNEEIARSGGTGVEGLAVQFDDRRPNRSGDNTDNNNNNSNRSVATARDRQNRKRNGSNNVKRSGAGTGTGKAYVAPSDEVDLSGSISRDKIRQGSLEWNDVSKVYRRKQFVVQRCYERAIKKNPLLKVGKTFVTLEIGQNGRVSRVVVPSLTREELGGCLVASIGKWRFPKSTEGWNGKFPIVFRAN